MPQSCTICRHPERTTIDGALVESEPLRNIAERFGTTATSLHRHRQHLPAYLALAKDAKEMVNASGLLDRVEFLIDRLEGIARTPRTNELGRPPLPPFGKSAAAWCC